MATVGFTITHPDQLASAANPNVLIDGPKWNHAHTVLTTGFDTVLDTTGIYTLTNKTISATNNTIQIPYFAAELSANQGTTNGATNKILFNTKIADSNNWYDNVTNYRLTPLLAGKWLIRTTVGASGTTITELDVVLRKNGSTSVAQAFILASGAAAQSVPISKTVSFNGTTDYIEVTATAFGTGTLNFLGAPSSWFEATYLGA